MRLFGFQITRTKDAVPSTRWSSWASPSSGWWPVIRESFAGAWQRNIEIRTENVLSFAAVYACVTLIASDIAKLRLMLMEKDADGIWQELERDSPFWPVLRKPNHYQNRIQFFQHWMLSKLIHGNTYVLKYRDQRGIVTRLYVLDPLRVRPHVSPDGSVFYAVSEDNLSGTDNSNVLIPASEIIHDRMEALYHPLCGVSPISACGLPAIQALRAMENAASFFEHGAQPGGLLVTPGIINDEDAEAMQARWKREFSGDNFGQVAVLGNGLTYQPLNMVSAVDSELIDQLKLSAEMVCTAYKVPAYKVNVGSPPSYNNIEALDQQYYGQCLMIHIELIERLLDEGLALEPLGTQFDIDALLRMDTATRVKAAQDAVGSGAVAPNEARKRWLDLGPVTGGESCYLQQQNFSLEALAKRDAQDDPFGAKTPAQAQPSQPADTPDADDEDKAIFDWQCKALEMGLTCN